MFDVLGIDHGDILPVELRAAMSPICDRPVMYQVVCQGEERGYSKV
jgi:hypothetical protein